MEGYARYHKHVFRHGLLRMGIKHPFTLAFVLFFFSSQQQRLNKFPHKNLKHFPSI